MTAPAKVYVRTFGCQMNVYDSERMAELLGRHGFAQTATPEEADLIVLNTCHIREKAAEKVYSDLGRIRQIKAARAEAPPRPRPGRRNPPPRSACGPLRRRGPP